MSDAKVSFLLKAASILSGTGNNKSIQILKSHYFLKTRKIAGRELPKKYLSNEVRCRRCCIEWNADSEIVVKPIKLTKKQRRRIKCNNKNRKLPVSKDYLLHSNQLEKICSFCDYAMKIVVQNPNRTTKHVINDNNDYITKNNHITLKENKIERQLKNNEINVYCESKVAFCLRKQETTLPNPNVIKIAPKIIKNNKKKKDKFAGLCQTAVIAATKLKEEKEKLNKLSLFLKHAS